MIPDPISLTVGIVVAAFGLTMLWMHRVAWQQQQIDHIDDPRELRHLQSRFRRRAQTSGLIALVGVLIPIADLPIVWKVLGPIQAAIVWMAIVFLCLWIGLLAFGDWLTTRAHARATLARLQVHKAELMNQIERLRPDAPKKDDELESTGGDPK